MDFIKQLQKQSQTSIFISSHVLTEVDQYADSITILDGGRAVFSGDLNEINQSNNHYKKYILKVKDQKAVIKLLNKAGLNWIFKPDQQVFYLYSSEQTKIDHLLHDLILEKKPDHWV